MRYLGVGLFAFVLCHGGRAAAETAETWPALEDALGPLVQVEAANTEPRAFTLAGAKCPKIPIEDYKAFTATVRFEPRRTLKMQIVVGRLPAGFDVYGPIVAAAPPDPGIDTFFDGCLMPKSGLSLLQVERYLISFPTVCSDIYPYKKSLPIVIQALKQAWGTRLPKDFIYSPCGTMYPRLVEVAEYLRDTPKPVTRGR